MKQSLDWFKHDATASESPKFIALRASPYGWAGEGRFWALNGLIARSDGCQLDLGRKFAKAGVADKLDLTPAELDAYIAGGEWEGKAGAYGIQDSGDRFITKTEGSFSNVVGLPLELLREMLDEFSGFRVQGSADRG